MIWNKLVYEVEKKIHKAIESLSIQFSSSDIACILKERENFRIANFHPLQILRIQGLTNITYNFPTNETPELFYCISKRRGAGGKKMAFDEGWRRRVDFVTCSRMIRFGSAIRNCIVGAARRRKLRNELFQGL